MFQVQNKTNKCVNLKTYTQYFGAYKKINKMQKQVKIIFTRDILLAGIRLNYINPLETLNRSITFSKTPPSCLVFFEKSRKIKQNIQNIYKKLILEMSIILSFLKLCFQKIVLIFHFSALFYKQSI